MNDPATHYFQRRFAFQGRRGKDGLTELVERIDIQRPLPDQRATVAVALEGFDVQFTNADHDFGQLVVLAEVVGQGPFRDSVSVRVSVVLRDSNGDDPFQGWVDVGLFVFDRSEVEVHADHLSIGPNKGKGPATKKGTHEFAVGGKTPIALLRGFDARYSERGHQPDHDLLHLEARIAVERDGARKANLTATCGVRDSSGTWDDRYDGSVHYSLLGVPPAILVRDENTMVVGPIDPGDRPEFPRSSYVERALAGTFEEDEVHAVLGGIQLGYSKSGHHVKRLMVRASARLMNAVGGWTRVRAMLESMVHDKDADDKFSVNADVILLGGKRRDDAGR